MLGSSKSRAGKQYGSRGKDGESFKLWPHHFSRSRDSCVRDREGSHLNCNTSTVFGGSVPFQAAFGIKCLPCVSGLLGWWNPKSVRPKRESMEGRVRDPGFMDQPCSLQVLTLSK